MSAFQTNKRHIDALIDVAIRGPKGTRPGTWYGPRYGVYRRPVEYGWNADEIGTLLAHENAVSVRYRYQDSDLDDMVWWDPQAYEFEWLPDAARPTAAEALCALACLEYQSCEMPTWKETDAHAFLRHLESCLISVLPGYDGAPWHWDASTIQKRLTTTGVAR